MRGDAQNDVKHLYKRDGVFCFVKGWRMVQLALRGLLQKLHYMGSIITLFCGANDGYYWWSRGGLRALSKSPSP